MNATMNHATVMSSRDRQRLPYYQNKINNRSTTYYYFPQPTTHSISRSSSVPDSTGENENDEEEEEIHPKYPNDFNMSNNNTPNRKLNVFEEDRLLLESASELGANFCMLPSNTLHKSNSYCGYMRPKATILKHDSVNGRIATSLTDDEIASGSYKCTFYEAKTSGSDLQSNIPSNNYDDDAVIDLSDERDLLMPSGTNTSGSGGGVGVGTTGNATTSTSRRNTRGTIKIRGALFSRILLQRKCLLGFAFLLLAVIAFLLIAYFTRGYIERFLFWIEMQNKWIIIGVLIPLFVAVSFPIVVGYFVLMLTSGYLFGAIKGVLIIIVGANLGVAVAHWTIRSFRHRIPVHKLIKNETGRAILRVIAGPKAFKVVLFTRLTPIPFGLQNTIFAISTINPRIYHLATFLGLMPAQIINAYLGSTLRSMQEVFNNHGTAVTGYITFALELICGIGLMVWVVQKARKELAETLLSDISNEGKLKEIDV